MMSNGGGSKFASARVTQVPVFGSTSQPEVRGAPKPWGKRLSASASTSPMRPLKRADTLARAERGTLPTLPDPEAPNRRKKKKNACATTPVRKLGHI